ncbi:hypothetical protein LTS10_000361 [Elasticomyces elasticus]|nr:hypothetical protein LTS10_000361 [Elasticomyces elasticus]
MAEQPFRLLDLPPELRVRIYECLYQDEAARDIDYLTLRKQIPTVAITLTNSLIRHEVMPLYEGATKCFYQEHYFYIKMHMPKAQRKPDGQRCDTSLPEDMRDILAIVAAMPQLPVPSIRLYLCLESRGSGYERGSGFEDLQVDVRVTSDGEVEATHLWVSSPMWGSIPQSGAWLSMERRGIRS